MTRLLPGTPNNFERSADRDFYWSMLLRFPHTGRSSRSCDSDSSPLGTQIICNECGLPTLLMEAIRGCGYKASKYNERWAKRFGCEAFVVSHCGKWVPSGGYKASSKEENIAAWNAERKPSLFFNVEHRPSGVEVLSVTEGDVEEQFLLWVESEMEKHICQR